MAATVPPVHRMANDIATHLQHLPSDEASEAIAGHIRTFWDPRMRAQLIDQVGQDGTRCDPTVAAAVDLLRKSQGR